jgi:hypothetical protein
VLYTIIVTIACYAAVLDSSSHLNSKPARRQWEAAFSDTYIRTVAETVDQNIHTAFHSIMKDNDQGMLMLF